MTSEAEKLTQIFKFLREFEQIQNPARLRIEQYEFAKFAQDIPSHPDIQIALSKVSDDASVTEPLLRVRRPKLAVAPKIPADLEDWLVRTPDDPFKEPIWKESLTRRKGENEFVEENFNDAAKRVEAKNSWMAKWTAWAELERPNRMADEFFKWIYTVHGMLRQDSERYELVLGDGILSSVREGVFHPILLQKLSLEFDPAKPEFTVFESEAPLEFETQLLWALKDKDVDQIRACNKEMTALQMSILDQSVTSAFLQRVTHGAVSDAHFYESRELASDQAPPNSVHCFQGPIFIVRKRHGGFAHGLEMVLEDIPKRVDLSPSLLQVCGLENPLLEPSEDDTVELEDPSRHYGNERKEILFTKPANQDQIKIIERLERHGTVLVQGPPGTGKSHTIGNLIGHLLARGKRILVTAKTAKALSVVRRQVVENLQPLCVSVLEDDSESRDELEKAVASVLERLGHSDPRHLRQQAKTLLSDREEILAQLVLARQKALELRTNEYRAIGVAGQFFSPTEAAKLLKAGSGIHDWIPGSVSFDSPLPLAPTEIAALYNTNTAITHAEEEELARENPDLAELPIPEEFANLVSRSLSRDLGEEATRRRFWKSAGCFEDLAEFEGLLDEIEDIRSDLACSPQWSFILISDGLGSEEVREKWFGLAALIGEVYQEFLCAQKSLLDFAPEVNSEQLSIDFDTLCVLGQEIADHVSATGRISTLTLTFKPKWKQFIKVCQTNGRQPRAPEEFRAISTLLGLKRSRAKLLTRWARIMQQFDEQPVGTLGEEPERILLNFVEEIRWRMDWKRSRLESVLKKLLRVGFNWDAYLNAIPLQYDKHAHVIRLREALERLPEMLSARAKAISITTAKSQLNELAAKTAGCSNPKSGLIAKRLRLAVQDRDVESYKSQFETLNALRQKEDILRERVTSLEKLRASAPAWAEAIIRRSPGHEKSNPPGEVKEAWLYAQLRTALDLRTADAANGIDEQIESLVTKLFDKTAAIVEAMAWASQLEHIEHNQRARMALQGWLQTVKAIGRGKGKMVPGLKAAAKKEMEAAKDAVPVWIMPLQRVLENFDPITTKFDVIIVDEASQCDMLGLVPLYMSRQVVIVGDHEQVSPDAVGEELDKIGPLVTTHLEGIPQAHLYSGKQSVYDLAQRAFSGHIMLREHFRCDAKIISFSNRLCYGGAIVPLRDTSRIRLKPPLVAHKVDGHAHKKVNQDEAVTISSLIAAALEQPEYQTNSTGQPVSIGVICMVGTEQAQTIRKLIYERLDPRIVERHRIMCGSPAQFQGDERDVIFISMVDSPEGGPLTLRAVDGFKKRFNVAASRARDQMWVVYSLDPSNDLKPGDFRRQLIEHAINPDAVEKKIEDALTHAQSEFERRVLRRLVGEGYTAIPQYPVGSCRIDIVVRSHENGSQLAVELDGEQFHPPSQLAADLSRQAMLERAGWRFIRIRGSKFFRDEESALIPLYKKLQQLGITPGSNELLQEPDKDELVERVRRRASVIKHEWQQNDREEIEVQVKDPRPSANPEANLGKQPTEKVRLDSSPKNGNKGDSVSLNAPITLAKFAIAARISRSDVERVAWTEAFFTGKFDEPLPKKTALKVASSLGMEIQE
jgi:very-short-patch-repair endonuclease